MPQLDGQSMQKLFALEAKKHLSLQNRKSSLQLRVRRQLSREGTTVLQKEGAPINALPLQRSPLPLYTKKKKEVPSAANYHRVLWLDGSTPV